MKQVICKTCNLPILVDDRDLELVSMMLIHHCNGYPYTTANGREINIAAVILNVAPGIHIDHKDGNNHNAQRDNIRPCTVRQNMWNKSVQSNNKVGYKGVFQSPGSLRKPFRAQITIADRTLSLGRFANVEDAARAYDEAAKKHYGEFARLNFP